MSPVEWFYAQENKRFGPVSAAELKALADAGKLQPDDLVWREGMDNWVPARRVKGLFEVETPTPDPTPVAQTEAAEVPEKPENVPVFTPPPASPFPTQSPPTEGRGRGFETSLTAFYRAREGISLHVFDFILDLLRQALPATLVEATCQTFSVVGYYTLYGTVVVLMMLMVALSIDTKEGWLLGWGIAEGIALVVLQYTAGRFLPALDRLNKSSPGRVCSTAFLDCSALLLLALGVAGVLALVAYAVQQNQYLMILLAIELFIVVELGALIAVAPETIQIVVSPETRAGEEALGVWTFSLKLLVKLTPVLFGLGVIQGTIELLTAAVFWLSKKPEAIFSAQSAFAHLAIAAALPLLVYVLFLSSYLTIDLMRAILELPRLLRKAIPTTDQQATEEN